MNITSLSPLALPKHASSLLDKGTDETGPTLNAVLSAPPLDLSGIDIQARLAEPPHSLKSQLAHQRLAHQQAALGQQALAGLARQGIQLSKDVSFSLDAKGALAVTGTTTDVDKVQAFFKHDTTRPSIHDQLSDVLEAAQALSKTAQTNNVISMAARYAGSATSVMSLYNQLMPQQVENSAQLTLSTQGSSLSYAGMFNSKA